MTSRFMLIFAAISGFIFGSGRFWRACVKVKPWGAVEMGWIQTGLEYRGVSYAGDLRSGGGNAASHQYLVLLE